MTAKVGVLLVHGIGAQAPDSLVEQWAKPLRRELDRVLQEQSRHADLAKGLHFEEYLWDPHVRAFSGLAVTAWALMNLPRITATHAALSYRARPKSVTDPDTVSGAIWQLISRIRV